MRRKDLRPGTEVYHTLLTHFGKGVVRKVLERNVLESMFEKGRGRFRIIVDFKEIKKTFRLHPQELRKTPNKKKIRNMVEFYAKRGEAAADGGDRLILPNTKYKGGNGWLTKR